MLLLVAAGPVDLTEGYDTAYPKTYIAADQDVVIQMSIVYCHATITTPKPMGSVCVCERV